MLRRVGLAATLLLPLSAGCEGKSRGGSGGGDASQSVENLAPRYTGKTTKGEYVALEDYRGKVVLLNIWATWCAPCRKELPELKTMHKAYGQDFMVLGISVDKSQDFAKVQNLMRQFNIDYPVVLDSDGSAVGKFNIAGYPTSILIGRDGSQRWRRAGIIQPHDSEADAEIKAALAAG